MINSGERGFGLTKFSRDERTRRPTRSVAVTPSSSAKKARAGWEKKVHFSRITLTCWGRATPLVFCPAESSRLVQSFLFDVLIDSLEEPGEIGRAHA